MALDRGTYFEELQKRAKDSHVHREFQLIGLEIAETLKDRAHKSLYIKLAKQHPRPHDLLAIAKEIAEKKDVKRKGAYFMAVTAAESGTRRAKSEVFRYRPSKNKLAKPRKTRAKKTNGGKNAS